MSEHDDTDAGDEGYSRDDHREECAALIAATEKTFPAARKRTLSEALYSFSELSLFGDFEIKDTDEAIRIWALVEKVRLDGFPTKLRM
jgi:hypothetical protein